MKDWLLRLLRKSTGYYELKDELKEYKTENKQLWNLLNRAYNKAEEYRYMNHYGDSELVMRNGLGKVLELLESAHKKHFGEN